MRRFLALAVFLSVPAAPALANAFLKEKGKADIISSNAIFRQRAGLSGGVAAQGYSSFYAEYGAFEKATLIAGAGYQNYTSQGIASTVFDTAYAGSRVLLDRWGNSVLSAEVLGGVSGIRETFAPGSAIAIQGTATTRIGFGYGFDVFGRHGFAGTDAAWRWRPGPPADEILLDATLGIEPWSSGLLMLQSFAIAGVGPASGAYRRYDLVRFQLSLAQRVSERWWVQIGALVTAAGVDSGNAGGVIALWWRV
jgi:hypothetical protein